MIRFHPDAIEEGRTQREWYAARTLPTALQFDAALMSAWKRIEEGPKRWPADEDGLRRYKLPGFPQRIVYWVGGDDLFVVAIAHGARRPRYWIERLRERP